VYSALQEHQKEDPFCKQITHKVLVGDGGGAKFQLQGERLCYYPKGAKRRRRVVPVLMRPMLLKYVHDSAGSGNLGARKTFHKVAANFWWPKMQAEVFGHVKKCVFCQRTKSAKTTQVGLHSTNPSFRPMERLFIDFVGPLIRTKRGNVAILVIVDGFSKFVTLHSVRRISASVVVEYLERTYFPAYGTPMSIVSDNATAFRCKQMKDLCFRLGINHYTTTPYYPQASLAERVNRNLKAALKIFHHESQVSWDEDLSLLSLAFNTAAHESHKGTPDKLFLGRELKCPLAVRWDLTPESNGAMEHMPPKFWETAYKNLIRAQRRVAHRYNSKRKPHQYQTGDTVLYRLNLVSSKAQNVSAKLLLKWSRPMTIAKFVRPNVVLLANPEKGVIVRRAHVSQLKAFRN